MSRRSAIRLGLAAVLIIAGLALAILFPQRQASGHWYSFPKWYSVIPPLLAVSLAFLTHRVLFSLAGAVLVGGLLMHVPAGPTDPAAWGDGVAETARMVTDVFRTRQSLEVPAGAVGGAGVGLAVAERVEPEVVGVNWSRVQIFLFVLLMLSSVMVMVASGGLQGVINLFIRFARTSRSTQVVTALTGVIVFIDDYANTMIVGNSMRPLTDRNRVSREKLAFLVDATAAPIAGVALLSTWIGYEIGLFQPFVEKANISSAYDMFLNSLPFYFYCFLMLAFVFVNAFSGKDYGPMRTAERRAWASEGGAFAGHPLGAGGPSPDVKVRAVSAIIPLAVLFTAILTGLWMTGGGPEFIEAQGYAALLSLSAWRDAMGDSALNLVLAGSAGVSLVAAVICAVAFSGLPGGRIARAILAGLRGSMLPLAILALAGAMQIVCDAGGLRTGEFLGELIAGQIPKELFPLLVFTVAGVTALATGTSWGTMGILIPIVFPIAFALDGERYGLITMISLAAVLDGSIFGDHCSPISDTTIMSSTASGCDHIEHVRTQMPYSLTVAAVALVGCYLPAALGTPFWVGLLGSIGALVALFLLMPRRGE